MFRPLSRSAKPKTAKAAPDLKKTSQKNASLISIHGRWAASKYSENNRNRVLSTLGGKQTAGKVEGLISLARMHLANGMWAEATGFLDFALDDQPELEYAPEVIALNGAAHALGRISDLAFEDLSDKQLEKFPEIGYLESLRPRGFRGLAASRRSPAHRHRNSCLLS